MKHAILGRIPDAVRSPPARGRGLKHFYGADCGHCHASPPARGRGLKLLNLNNLYED